MSSERFCRIAVYRKNGVDMGSVSTARHATWFWWGKSKGRGHDGIVEVKSLTLGQVRSIVGRVFTLLQCSEGKVQMKLSLCSEENRWL